MAAEARYSIHALCQGARMCDASLLLYLADVGRPARLPYFFWILVPESDGAPILVDTGFLEGDYTSRSHTMEGYRRPRELLAPFGLAPADVETVIVTHLHWDHFAANRLYASATWRSPSWSTG